MGKIERNRPWGALTLSALQLMAEQDGITSGDLARSAGVSVIVASGTLLACLTKGHCIRRRIPGTVRGHSFCWRYWITVGGGLHLKGLRKRLVDPPPICPMCGQFRRAGCTTSP